MLCLVSQPIRQRGFPPAEIGALTLMDYACTADAGETGPCASPTKIIPQPH